MFRQLQNKLLIFNISVTSIVVLTSFLIIYISTYYNIMNENEKRILDLTGSSSTFQVQENHMEDAEDDTGYDTEAGYSVITEEEEGESVIVHSNLITEDYNPSFILLFNSENEYQTVDSILDLSDDIYTEASGLVKDENSKGQVTLGGRRWMYQSFLYADMKFGSKGEVIADYKGDYQTIFLDITDSLKTLSSLLITFALVGVAVLIAIFIISIIFAKKAIHPVKTAWEAQNRFIADASHELKTPLSVITANYDALLSNEEQTIGSQREWFSYMKEGMDRMKSLIDSLLSLIRMEEHSVPIEKTQFDLGASVSALTDSLGILARDKGIIIKKMIESDVIVKSDITLVEQIITILLDNAIKYTDTNGQIEVIARSAGNHAEICIRNTGPGLSRQGMDKVFDRFYREDKSRTSEDGGHGLGLSIAKSAANRIDGRLKAESTDEWTTFTLQLKAWKSHS